MKVVLFALFVSVPALTSAISTTNFQGSFGVRLSPHIVGGNTAKLHEYPYQVGLRVTKGPHKEEFCGGALLSKKWVITAAHCLSSSSQAVAILGAHNITARETTVQKVDVLKYYVPPDWNPETLLGDIALAELADKLILTGGIVEPVRLPDSTQKNLSFWKHTVVITGWGKTNDSTKVTSPVLQTVTTKVITNFFCKTIYSFQRTISGSHICSLGSLGRGPCTGDSGGPMVIEDSLGQKTLIGISSSFVSYGCENGWPAVFTRVTSFMDWIHEITGIPQL